MITVNYEAISTLCTGFRRGLSQFARGIECSDLTSMALGLWPVSLPFNKGLNTASANCASLSFSIDSSCWGGCSEIVAMATSQLVGSWLSRIDHMEGGRVHQR